MKFRNDAKNIRRRHLNAGQRAILVALAYSEPTPGRPTKGSETEHLRSVHKADLSQARCIGEERVNFAII
jgi:hypothetical protein